MNVSVIIPTYNRPRQLATCLGALARSDYPRDCFEVIVVDDGGSRDLRPVIARFVSSLDVRCVRQRNGGPASARNAGARHARGQVLAFTDDDCAPHADWLKRIADTAAGEPAGLIGGRTRNALELNPYAATSQLIIDVVHAHFNRDARRATFFPSDNMAVGRPRFLEVGGFDTSFRWSEDRDLCDRWAARGWPLILAPAALVDHAHEMGFGGFCAQHFGYGRGAWRFHRARARRGTGHLDVEGGFYRACFREPFRAHRLRRAFPLATLLGVWQVVNTAGFFFEALCEHRAPRVPDVRGDAATREFTTDQASAGG